MSVGGAERVAVPGWIAGAVGPEAIERASRVGWGFRNEVWRVHLAGGRQLAVIRLVDTGSAASIVARTVRLQPRLRAVGIPHATVIDTGPASSGVLITEFVEGTVGAALLGDPGGPGLVGSILGAAWSRLAHVDADGLELDRTWLDAEGLAEASRARLGRVGPLLGGAGSRQLAEAVAVSETLLARRRPAFVHGDLVPVNVIVRGGKLAALIDFEFARIADPLLDAGWFDSIVAYHHPAEHPAAWRAFLLASGIDAGDPVTRDLLRILPMLRYLEILDDRSTAAERVPHWTAMLRAQLARA